MLQDTPYEARFATGLRLDRRWHALRGGTVIDKQDAMRAIAEAFAAEHVPWALIGGVALQLRLEEPRTTLDIDIAVTDRRVVPRAQLEARGFRALGQHEHSDNWASPDGTPLQIADDPEMAAAVQRAEPIQIGDLTLHVVQPGDLLRLKLRAARDPARRRSKRAQDRADCFALLEQHPGLSATLTSDEHAFLDS